MPMAAKRALGGLRDRTEALFPGFCLAAVVAMAAQFVAEHSQAPAMLMALLFGMAVSFAHEQSDTVAPGIEFAAKSVLKIGIVLLGARISVDVVLALGWQTLALLTLALAATLTFGVVVGRAIGLSTNLSILTAGAVSICGASAALAISSVLPRNEQSEKQLFLTIVGVTTLSTVAMILYPAILSFVGAGDLMAGRVIGATIHDVAQVVGAGFSVSEPAGEVATIVKLVRVTLLAPTVILLALYFRQTDQAPADGKRPPIVPPFVAGFVIVALLNSFGFIPELLNAAAVLASKSALLVAIAAVGIKTNLRKITELGYAPISLMVLETAFIAIFCSIGFWVWAH